MSSCEKWTLWFEFCEVTFSAGWRMKYALESTLNEIKKRIQRAWKIFVGCIAKLNSWVINFATFMIF